MQVIETIQEMREYTRGCHKHDREVGFVPTMGFLHDGHLSLIDRACRENDAVVVSIFVNPTQFMAGEDFDAYPRDITGDLEKAEAAGADAVFVPTEEIMYGPGSLTSVYVAGLTDHLCGITRGAGHFRGVCTVVSKLFNIVQPDRAYFGQKDAQQAVIISHMVADLNFPVDVCVCPIVREIDGLAMSSRNSYLSDEERTQGLVLIRALRKGREKIQEGERSGPQILGAMMEEIEREPQVELDYLEIVDPRSLREVDEIEDTVLMAGAIRVGSTRLIDNLLVNPESGPWSDGDEA